MQPSAQVCSSSYHALIKTAVYCKRTQSTVSLSLVISILVATTTVYVLCSHALVPGHLQLRGQLRDDGSAAAGQPRTLRRPLPRLLCGGCHRQGRQRGDARRLGGGGDGPAGTPDQLMRRPIVDRVIVEEHVIVGAKQCIVPVSGDCGEVMVFGKSQRSSGLIGM